MKSVRRHSVIRGFGMMEKCNLPRHVVQVPNKKESLGGVSSGLANGRHLGFSNGGYFAILYNRFQVETVI